MNETPLHHLHVQFGAKMVDFAGWHMPLLYRGIIEEHNHTRNACSVFDVSHMGRLRIDGADAGLLLQRLCTRNLGDMVPGQSRYSHICREDGGILDDVIVSKFEDSWLVVCNASNRGKIVGWIETHAQGRKATLTDRTFETAMLALQGPKTLELAARLVPIDLTGVKRFRFVSGQFFGMEYMIARSGYTGEDGYEVIMPAKAAALAAPHLLGSMDEPHEVVKPAGLAARDTLRIEAAMPLYGHELHEDIDSLSAGLGWCVDLSVDFIGAEAMRKLEAAGLKVKLVGLEVEGRRIARQGTPVLAGGRKVGDVTSGSMSPTLDTNIAMAFVEADMAELGTEFEIDFGRTRSPAMVVPLPFYKREKA